LGIDRSSSSRRELLRILAASSAASIAGTCPVLARLAAVQPCADAAAAGTLLGTLPLSRAGAPVQPFGVKFGRGLDARLVTDLSQLAPDRLITPNPLAYIRTECPPDVATDRRPWAINVSGLVERSQVLSLDELNREARPMGAHLFECAGNNNPANFGLMSVAEWDGVPLAAIVSRLGPGPDAKGLLVSGRDYRERSADSLPGASWIFPLASLERLGAFLAVRMNGEALPVDHGKPVRLVVPGWYGCAWIKWVDELRLVGQREPATSQMREFAGRTHQSARHDFAIDYTPPEIQAAAMPVRAEKRRVSNDLEYRIVGVVWGGTKPLQRLAIRFGAGEPWTPFSICPIPTTHAIWSLWEYRWRPASPGVYSVSLTVPDPTVPQRRLSAGYYAREIQIHEL
jgi:DMSO/TMAO reductase YedYZ molybdopterin-dependent catalytic subunit